MDITIKIPNGTMYIHAEPFFAEAGRAKVRRILRLLRDTWPSQTQVEELKSWLREQMQAEKDRQKQAAENYQTMKSKLAEWEEDYQRTQSSCYAVFTRDKTKLKQARDRIVWCQSYCRQYETELKQAQRQVQRYQGCLGDVKAILEGE